MRWGQYVEAPRRGAAAELPRRARLAAVRERDERRLLRRPERLDEERPPLRRPPRRHPQPRLVVQPGGELPQVRLEPLLELRHVSLRSGVEAAEWGQEGLAALWGVPRPAPSMSGGSARLLNLLVGLGLDDEGLDGVPAGEGVVDHLVGRLSDHLQPSRERALVSSARRETWELALGKRAGGSKMRTMLWKTSPVPSETTPVVFSMRASNSR